MRRKRPAEEVEEAASALPPWEGPVLTQGGGAVSCPLTELAGIIRDPLHDALRPATTVIPEGFQVRGRGCRPPQAPGPYSFPCGT